MESFLTLFVLAAVVWWRVRRRPPAPCPCRAPSGRPKYPGWAVALTLLMLALVVLP